MHTEPCEGGHTPNWGPLLLLEGVLLGPNPPLPTSQPPPLLALLRLQSLVCTISGAFDATFWYEISVLRRYLVVANKPGA